MAVVTQLYFKIVEEINYMFRLFTGWAIIRLKLEFLMYSTRCSVWVFSDTLVSNWWWPTQKMAETCSWFLQQFENTIVLRLPYTHLISTSAAHAEDIQCRVIGWFNMTKWEIFWRKWLWLNHSRILYRHLPENTE
jgi:hypothetical protein